MAFARRFGEIEHLFGDSGIVPISNQRRDGSLLGDDEPAMQIMRGNEGWHTDSSYMPLAAKASILSAHTWCPGPAARPSGPTCARPTRRSIPRRGSRIAGLSAYHSIRYSQARIGDTSEFGYGYHDGDPPLRPLVKLHPVTGRPSLFIGRHAYGIPTARPGRIREAARRGCSSSPASPPRVHRHAWQPGDVVVWDNRCVLHRARPYDHSEPRVMKHTRIAGDPATEQAWSR